MSLFKVRTKVEWVVRPDKTLCTQWVDDSSLAVGTLLRQPELGLRLVVEGDLNQQVQGAHAIEVEDASRWLEPGWVMLTTGMRFAGVADSRSAQEQLVRDLTDRGVVALLFGVGVHFSDVPAALIRAAKEARLNLLSIDADVPFLQIEQFVTRFTTSTSTTDVHQRLALQNDLLQSLASDQPVVAFVQRLAALTRGTAALYEWSGRIVTSTGEGPVMLIWSEIESVRGTELHCRVGRWHVVARPVVLRGVGYWIALASQRETVLDRMGPSILDVTQQLLGALRGVRALGASQAVAESSEIMRALRADVSPDGASRIWERLRAFRFERGRPLRAFVATPTDPAAAPGPDTAATDAGDDAVLLASDFGLPVLVDIRDGTMDGLVGHQGFLDEWAERLAAAGLHVGLSEPFDGLHHTRARIRDAQRALQLARRNATRKRPLAARADSSKLSTGAVLRFEDTDVVTWLRSSRSEEAFAAKVQQQFAELLENDDLVETLQVYLASGLDIKATATATFLHPNSVRYRLRRVEQLIGADLRSAPVIANLYLALCDRLPESPG